MFEYSQSPLPRIRCSKDVEKGKKAEEVFVARVGVIVLQKPE